MTLEMAIEPEPDDQQDPRYQAQGGERANSDWQPPRLQARSSYRLGAFDPLIMKLTLRPAYYRGALKPDGK